MIGSPQSLPVKFLPNRSDILVDCLVRLYGFFKASAKEWQDYEDCKPLQRLFYVIVVIDTAKPRSDLGMICGGRIKHFSNSAWIDGLVRQHRRYKGRDHARQNQKQNRQLREPAGYLRRYPMN